MQILYVLVVVIAYCLLVAIVYEALRAHLGVGGT